MSDPKRVLRIHVAEAGTDKVNITVPLGLAKLAKIGGIAEKLSEKHGIDLEEILDDIEEAPDGKLIDVVDEQKGDHVEIFIETADRPAEVRA